MSFAPFKDHLHINIFLMGLEWSIFCRLCSYALYDSENVIVLDSEGVPTDVVLFGGDFCDAHKGDINYDGGVDILDVVKLVGAILQIITLNICEYWAADLNGDWNLNWLDIPWWGPIPMGLNCLDVLDVVAIINMILV